MRRSASLALPLFAALVVGCNGSDSNTAANTPANDPANTAANTTNAAGNGGTNAAENSSANNASGNTAANAGTNSAANAGTNEAANAGTNAANAPSGPKVGITTTKPGTGPGAQDGSLLSMRYTGKLLNGKQFDSNASGGKAPFNLVLGQGSVIKGWEEGLQGIKAGEKRTLRIPAAKGYGEKGTPDGSIPPNSDLLFDVEALAVIPKEKQAVIQREELKPGKGSAITDGRKVTFHYIGKILGGDEFDNSRKRQKPLSVTVGKGELIPGMDAGLVGMKVGGQYRLTIPPAVGYGQGGDPSGRIQPNSILVFEIEVLKVG